MLKLLFATFQQTAGDTHWTLLDNVIHFTLFIKINKIYVKHTCKSWILQMAILQPAPFNKNKPMSTNVLLCLGFILLCYQYVPKQYVPKNSGAKKWSHSTSTKICSFSKRPLRLAPKVSQTRYTAILELELESPWGLNYFS